jgi:hypothetical protein
MCNNNLPYRYLDLTLEPLLPEWKEVVLNFNSLFHYKDFDGNYLKPKLKKLFLDKGLIPMRGNLWSRPPRYKPHYHTDQKVSCEKFAINWLLIGQPGITEWSYSVLNHKIDEKTDTPLFENIDPQFWGPYDTDPDVTASLDKPMMIQTDIPHRVNTTHVYTWRISYSLRFKNNPTWEEGLEKLKDFIIE